MRLQPRFVFFICALVPIVLARTIPRRSGNEVPIVNYDAMVKDQQMENEDRDIEERRSGRRTYLNSGLLFGKRYDETGDFLTDDEDDETRHFNVEIRGRSRVPFHSALMQGKRTPFEAEEDMVIRSKKRPRPVFHSGIMLGKRFPLLTDETAIDKRKKSRLRWSDGMLFGK